MIHKRWLEASFVHELFHVNLYINIVIAYKQSGASDSGPSAIHDLFRDVRFRWGSSVTGPIDVLVVAATRRVTPQ